MGVCLRPYDENAKVGILLLMFCRCGGLSCQSGEVFERSVVYTGWIGCVRPVHGLIMMWCCEVKEVAKFGELLFEADSQFG